MTTNVVPVSVLSAYLRQLFESDPVLSDIWVEGEVSEVFTSKAGHVYFTLRDADSLLKSVMFRAQAQRQRVIPRAGDQIAAHGRVTIYDKSGAYQLYVDVIDHAGQGMMALQFERLRQKLEADGLFDESRKRPLPAMPVHIGVVTSGEGAVWHDIQNVMRRRYPLAHLILAPAPVQGIHAPAGVIAALERLQHDGRADLIIVARGGGSAEDLAAFNDERIARAVFACKVPVISAIGHETDWTIIDLVADLRAPTPSAAAEMCAPSVDELRDEVRDIAQRGRTSLAGQLRERRFDVASRSRILDSMTPGAQVASYRAEITRLASALSLVTTTMLPARRTAWRYAGSSLRDRGASIAATRRADVVRYAAVLDALSPAHVIGRGYAALESRSTGSLVTSIHDVAVGDYVIAWLSDGSLDTRVQRVDGIDGVSHNEGA